jgi:integrase
MSLWKRGEWHWADFTVNGTRYRVPLQTKDHREAIQRERELIDKAREGTLPSGRLASLARLGFDEAVDRYLSERRIEISGSQWEGWLTERLRPFFRGKRLNQITADNIRQYQAHRIGEGKHPNTVNHEVKALLRLLKRAKLLSRIRDDVKLLPVKREPREVLTEAQKQRLFQTASSKPEWQTAYCAALLTANTSMRPCEIKRLKWGDIDAESRIVTVRLSKTKAGTRTIPLNDEAWSAIAAMKQRADALETYALDFYIFPRMLPTLDAKRPMGQSGWRTAWRSLRKAAGMPQLRFYTLRHQCITEMLEGGIPEGVIREIAGHVDPQMTKLYSHPRMTAKRIAVAALSHPTQGPIQGEVQGGYVTKYVTKQLPAAIGIA